MSDNAPDAPRPTAGGPSLDRNWHIGVCGWQTTEGAHVRLADVLEGAGPDEQERLVREHTNACVLLALVLGKLRDELDEVRGVEDPSSGR